VEPAVEVATLVVSYLWALRTLFPEKIFVRDFAREPDPLSLKTIAERILVRGRGEDGEPALDFALLTRLQMLASRLPEQAWNPRATRDGGTQPVDASDLDEMITNASLNRLKRPAKEQGFRELMKYGVDVLNTTAVDDDYRHAAESCLADFARHAELLVKRFPDWQIREMRDDDPRDTEVRFTRETLTEKIAMAMVREGLLKSVSLELDYKPIVLRALRQTADLPDLLSDAEYPRQLIARLEREERALPFSLVQHCEIDEIEQSRKLRRGEEPPRYEPTLAAHRAYERCFLGLALSGGGIRSATFALGVLQGLSNKGWLPHIDYLSTVSGGGYIGSWLIAWIKRRGSVRAVQESMRGYSSNGYTNQPASGRNPDPASEHVRPIRLLREYSNYLTPVSGVFTADTWTLLSIWLRNTSLNLLTMTLFLTALLIAPQTLGLGFIGWDLRASVLSSWVCVWLASFLIGLNLRSFDESATPSDGKPGRRRFGSIPAKSSERGDTSLLVITTIVLPGLAASFFATRALWAFDIGGANTVEVFLASFIPLSSGIAITVLVGRPLLAAPHGFRRFQLSPRRRIVRNLRGYARSIAWGAVASSVGALALMQFYQYVFPILHSDSRRGAWIALALGPATVQAVLGGVIVLYLGLEGRDASEEHREWWSRLGAWLALTGIGWCVLALVSFFAPYAVAVAGLYAGTLGIGWTAFTALGAYLGASGKSNGVNLPLDKKLVSWLVISLAPYMFMIGFLITVAVLGHAMLYLLQDRPLPFTLDRYVDTYWAFLDPSSAVAALVCAGLLGAATLLASRVDVNDFSMHHFYKNRLVRAYLGASRARIHRRPNAFTGFDMHDDIKLWRFRHDDRPLPSDATSDCRAGYAGPFPIINTTLNLTSGDELAWQERKGQSFVFTPIYSGYDFTTKQTAHGEKVSAQFGHRPTRLFGNGEGTDGADSGLGIGTAVAISGAAANPNAGYHTSPAVAFMLTLFNARLGWWMGNPRLQKWKRQSPRFGLAYLASELFGFSGVHRQYINLSDGGHFENLGLYELVRRRCRCIIVCDGEQDDRYAFNGLAGAIRKCRVDFGVVIELPTKPIEPMKKAARDSRRHAVVGTITYPGQRPGVIIYLKASVTGDEPPDVREYRHRHPEFPHQATGDQFFDESQFESYRALGQHVADEIFPDWDPPRDQQQCAQLESLVAEVVTRCRLTAVGPSVRREQP
jgi:hypothetical protein